MVKTRTTIETTALGDKITRRITHPYNTEVFWEDITLECTAPVHLDTKPSPIRTHDRAKNWP